MHEINRLSQCTRTAIYRQFQKDEVALDDEDQLEVKLRNRGGCTVVLQPPCNGDSHPKTTMDIT